MSFWSSFTASLRNFGNRIARIFTRKKDRHLESSQAVEERNQKTSKNALGSPNTVTDPKNVIHPLNDAPVEEERFQKCTSYSPQSKKSTNFKSSRASLEQDDSDSSDEQMEGKRKDINEIYREMEEAVAKRVRETMELADARRRALAQSGVLPNQKQTRVDNEREIVELSDVTEHFNIVDEDEDAIRTNDAIDTEDHLRMEEIQQEFKDINKSIEEEQSKMYKVAEVDDTVKDTESTGEKTEDTLQIGSNFSEATVNAQKDTNIYNILPIPENTATYTLDVIETAIKDNSLQEIDHSTTVSPLKSTFNQEDQKLQVTFDLPANDTQYRQVYDKYELESELKLTQDDLNTPAQYITRNTENIPQEFVESTIITQIIQPITNNPFDMMENDELADTLIRDYGTNPFESSDDEVEIRLGEGTMSVVQNWRNQTKNPFDSIDDEMDTRQLGEEALNIARNASRNFAMNPFDMIEEEDMEQIGTNALSIAQTGASNIEAAKRQLSENAEDIDNVFNSLIDSADPMVEIGFDHLEREMRDKDRNIAINQVPQV